MAIATVINYCTNDYRFLSKAAREALLFSKQVLIPVSDHFFDGTAENRPLLERSYAENPACTFIEFAYNVKRLYTPYYQRSPEDEDWGSLWHSTARYVSYLHLEPAIEWVLFLDADEIVDGARFSTWLSNADYKSFDAHWFWAYCYGLTASKRAPHLQLTGLLAKVSACSPLKILNSQERYGHFAAIEGSKQWQIFGLDGRPMFHHYSWVRTEEERAKKSMTWGKKHLCDWAAWLKEKEWEMNGYEDVEPFFDPLNTEIMQPQESDMRSSVIRISAEQAFRKEIDAIY